MAQRGVSKSGDGRRVRPLDLRVAGYLVGFAGGLAADTIADLGLRGPRGVVAAGGGAAVLAGLGYLRRLSPRAPLRRIASWVLMSGAAGAIIIALVNPDVEGYATLAAATLALMAVLLPTRSQDVLPLLSGIALIFGGVAPIGAVVEEFRQDGVAGALGEAGFLGSLIVLGVAVIRGSAAMRGFSLIALGATLAGDQVNRVLQPDPMTSNAGVVLSLLLAAAFVGLGLATWWQAKALLRAAFVALGLCSAGLAVAMYIAFGGGLKLVLFEIALVVAATALVGLGIETWNGSGLLRGISLLVLGVALVGLGGVAAWDDDELAGAALIAGGIACVATGIGWLRWSSALLEVRARLARLTRDPHREQ